MRALALEAQLLAAAKMRGCVLDGGLALHTESAGYRIGTTLKPSETRERMLVPW